MQCSPCTLENVLRAALSLYMEDGNLPLPTPEEMLICNENTTSEEVGTILSAHTIEGIRTCNLHIWRYLLSLISCAGGSVVAESCV